MFKNILLPIDLSDISREAGSVACDLARTHGAKLHFLYILPNYGYPVVAQYFSPEVEKEAMKEAAGALQRFIGGLDLEGIEWDRQVRKGRIYSEVLDCAGEIGADLIVIASHSPHGMERFMMGSNAEKVARYAHCSVLLLRHP